MHLSPSPDPAFLYAPSSLQREEEDFARLATLLAPDRRELFPREKLQRLLKAAEEAPTSAEGIRGRVL